MSTMVEPGTLRAWRVNRVHLSLTEVAAACADPRLTRARAQQLAEQLRSAAQVVADLYVCPVCGHPEACACTVCPDGARTATVAPDMPH